MLKKISIVISLLALAGCVSTKNVRIDQHHSEIMHGKTMSVTTSDKPDFAAMTAGKAMFAMIGAIAMINKGNEIVRTHDVSDPASYISEALADQIAAAHSVSLVRPIVAEKDDDIGVLMASVRSNSAYILDIRTINWSFAYFPTDWNNYRVIYSAKLRLIDVNGKQVIAEAFCSRVPDQGPESPSYDQLLDNNAERLKQELKQAADYCIQDFQQKVL